MLLDVFEYNGTCVADRLQFECNRTLKPIGQQFFRVSNEEVDFTWGQRLLQQGSNANVIMLALDDYFR